MSGETSVAPTNRRFPPPATDNEQERNVMPKLPLAILAPASMRKRLWQGGILLALVMMTIAVGNTFVPAAKAVHLNLLGHDFLAFYTAGTFVREQRAHDLYDLSIVRSFEHEIARAN